MVLDRGGVCGRVGGSRGRVAHRFRDAVGALDAAVREQMMGRQGPRDACCLARGPWRWPGVGATTCRSRAGRCAARLMYACRDRMSAVRRKVPLTIDGRGRRAGGA